MIRLNARGFDAIRRLCIGAVGLVVIGVQAPAAVAQVSGTWTTTGSLHTPRQAHTATLLPNGQMLVAGGITVTGAILASAELYNPATGEWTITANMAKARYDHTATLLPSGEVLVTGGIGIDNPQAPCVGSAELYDPATDHWHTTGSMITARYLHGATILQDGQVLVAGGAICWGFAGGGSPGSSAELYDPSSGTWKATGNMNFNHMSPLTLLQDGRALLTDETSELYHPSMGQWTLTPRMYYPSHSGITAALLTNGNVLIYGNQSPSYASEFYNPDTNTWAPTRGQSGTGISYGPLASLDNGKVLLAGGVIVYSGKSTYRINCFLYDPSTNTWSGTGTLKQAGRHTVTRLSNGLVLAVGGTDAELYTP